MVKKKRAHTFTKVEHLGEDHIRYWCTVHKKWEEQIYL